MQLVLKSQEAVRSDSAPPVAQGVPDIARRNRKVTEMLWLVRALATALLRDHHFSISQEDLESYGKCGLLEAADAFDYRSGTRFNTFAYYRIRGAMLDAIHYGAGQCTRTEMTAMQRRSSLLARLDAEASGGRGERRGPLERLTVIDHDFAHAIAERSHRDAEQVPTPEDFLEHNSDIAHLREAIATLPVLERRLVELLYFHHDGSFEAVGKVLRKDRANLFRIHARAMSQLRAAFDKELLQRRRSDQRFRDAIATLPARHRRVVELLYFHHDGSFEAVAKRLRRTRACIVRIHARALKQLRAALAEVIS
jgi:RNA polymerase sigma factor for flagellar operon FliA